MRQGDRVSYCDGNGEREHDQPAPLEPSGDPLLSEPLATSESPCLGWASNIQAGVGYDPQTSWIHADVGMVVFGEIAAEAYRRGSRVREDGIAGDLQHVST